MLIMIVYIIFVNTFFFDWDEFGDNFISCYGFNEIGVLSVK